jgi:Protein of unknown function (DUF3224)
MTTHATGAFTIKMTPQTWNESDQTLGRFLLDKQYSGDLEATSDGQMLSAGTAEKGSAGYVAIEKVTGKLQGRSGTFVLQHTGLMNRGNPELTIIVVPDSGTGELTGLGGTMTIGNVDGKKTYDFAYSLATIE